MISNICIAFVDSLYSFIYLFQLLVAMIYKGPMVLLIADIKLELVYSVVAELKNANDYFIALRNRTWAQAGAYLKWLGEKTTCA